LNTSVYKLENIDADLDPFIERVRDAHYVCLGKHPWDVRVLYLAS